ncbi:hypothetical protein R4J17_07835 [Brachyspira intermedia]|uniref:hypothetical protein n=1 Tax=Brachyspira intermedia TaxID=84377 RepID=UPI0030077F78
MGYYLIHSDLIDTKTETTDFHIFETKIGTRKFGRYIYFPHIPYYSICNEKIKNTYKEKIYFKKAKIKFSINDDLSNNIYIHFYYDYYEKIFYFDNYNDAMIFIAIYIEKNMCGTCISSLYRNETNDF